MKANMSSILLGVRDMDRPKRFYPEGSGWKVERDYGVLVFFESDDGSLTGFNGREDLAAEAAPSPEGSGISGLVLTRVAGGEARADEITADAKKAGATILKSAATRQWGGYGGSFAGRDGYIWDIGYRAQGKNQPYEE
jgi:predicted enzyme related to lactoylglutathione lyase